MSRYREIADVLRGRIEHGEYPVGSRLPGIAALQKEFGVPGLNTIRGAQQVLIEEGMLEARQGVGVFVISSTPRHQLDIVATVAGARDSLNAALAAMTAPQRSVTLDFDQLDEYAHFVLTSALQEWASQQRFEAENETDEPLRTKRLKWAAVAETLEELVEAAV
ncbi:GntR family transcriptional regulator [Amycolatopsis magusensis]|uniref:GntR family transcriptional regulator n=1 Tax=Amycolatopsis magusensis TaxID=882444 RepID=UPI003788345B